MTGRTLYFAEPIDQSDHGVWKESVTRAIKVATDRGWLVYRPAGAWRVNPAAPVGPEIEVANRAQIYRSTAVVAFLPGGVPSVGVPREVEWAAANGTPVIVFTDHARSWSLADISTIAIDDLPTYGQWLVALESVQTRTGTGVAFAVGERGRLPSRVNEGDAGFDLYVSAKTTIQPGEFADVPCDIRVALPVGIYARITGRSSTLRRRNLLVAEGIIDNGYRGQLYSGVFNLGDEPHTVDAGDRIAQLIIHENVSARHVPVAVPDDMFARIPGDSRGEAGFGSTGT